ncbi:MAG TPA: manganese efflux pump [Thermodesulfovibrionales bacterium]|nr:manganese efflux pump [Thermodesulfovibrionales bacterium]
MTELHFLAIILLSISASLDNFGVGISYGLRNICVPGYLNLFIAFVNSSGTLLAMLFGTGMSRFVRPPAADYAGAFLLIGVGTWILIMELRKRGVQKSLPRAQSGGPGIREKGVISKIYSVIDDPFAAGFLCSGNVTMREGVVLASALTLSNFSTGMAAGMLGYSLALTTVSAFVFNVLGISTGQRIGRFSRAGIIKDISGITSGILLVLIGIYEAAG